MARTKRSVAEKARKGDRKPPHKRGVMAKAVWDTSSNWLEGPPLPWLQEKHLPRPALGNSGPAVVCFYGYAGPQEELRFGWL